nr:putative ribonuclease H-like domain-containing protein [Tanacetum cinerariifolium]
MNYQPVVTRNQPNSSADPQTTDADAAFDDKENESKVYVSLSSSDKPKKHDDKAKKEAKGKSPVDLSTRVRNLSDEFKDFSSNRTNGVSAASSPVTAVGPTSTNSTNSFNVVDMPALEEVVYSDDEEDVGAEVDFSNLETTPQTRSMTRMVKDQGRLTQINDEDFHTCMFACFLSQEEPKRVHQALKDPSWIEAMQEELLQLKMQKVWVLVDLLKDSLLSIPFWAEAVNTTYYVQNRVLVTKPHNKTPYELSVGRTPGIGFMIPFGCPVTIINTLDPLGKFVGKADEGFLVGYFVNRNQPNQSAGIKENLDAGNVGKEIESAQQYVLLPLWSTGSQDPQNTDANAAFDVKENENEVHVSPSSSYKPKKHDEKAKREAKGKNMRALEDIVYLDDEEDVGAEADFSNLETNISVSPILTTRVHKDHSITQIIGELTSAPQTRSMARMGHTQEEGIDYKEVFAPVARIEAIWLFLAYASFMGFMVYQMDVKSIFLYGTIEEEVYVCQPIGFEDPNYPDKVYKVVKTLYGLHQAPRAWYKTLANYPLENSFQRGKIDQTLLIKKQKGDILLV